MLLIFSLLLVSSTCFAAPQSAQVAASNAVNAAQGNLTDQLLGAISPQCVTAREYPEWASIGARLDAETCIAAMAILQQKAGPDVTSDRIFWSKKVFRRPEKVPFQGNKIPLPDGGQNRKSTLFLPKEIA